ncbi:acyl-CoA dehydrogenase family protein [Maribacter antarcticus]|uniref:acyl-CoA dehydrogenase family protein n=1 Tax=Maribacter antarcticus TaxID=505250 RepID=UPI00047CD849|nr:acyl-CoA dehydrogenase family protein [Maribacter antarcticus]
MKTNSDYYGIDSYFTDEQLSVRASTRKWVNKYIKPTIEYYNQSASASKDWSKQLADIGAYGLIIPVEYGGLGMDYLSYGLMMQELEKGDTAVRVMSSIQTSLVMYAIWQFGSLPQKQKYLPLLASGEMLGSFGLTEPSFGSNASGMHCNFKVVEDKIIINGSKLWIGNASHADIAIVWAKNEDNKVQGIIVETANITNFSTSKIDNKWSFRSSNTGELIFDNSELNKVQLLEKTTSIKDAYSCLNIGRYAVAWGSLGIALDCYETALKYANERVQFGKPIASFQLVQKKLAEMITEITKAQLLCYQLGVLMNKQEATFEQISMAKRNNVVMAQKVAQEARQILGGMGITGDYPIMRHIMNLETLVTYQGTHEIHLLITGRDITGINAI